MLCACISACSANSININKLDRKETYPEFPGSLVTIYTSMEQLLQDADIIAEVTVNEQKVIPLSGFPQTRSQVHIDTLLKGDAAKGDIITVIEEGGVTEEETVIAGVPPMEQGKTYILYLTEYDGKYYVLGAFQGKFIIKEGYVFQQSTKDTKMEAYSPVTKEEFLKTFS